MPAVDVSFLISELVNEYENSRKTGRLAGSDAIFKLAKLATGVFRHSKGEAALVAHLLSSMLFELGEKEDRDAIGPDEAAHRFSVLDLPIVGALAVLKGQSRSWGPAAIALVEAFGSAT